MFSCEFCEILRTPFLQNTSGQLLLTRQSILWSCSHWKKSSDCFQKQPPDVFYENRCSKKFHKIYSKHLCQSLFLIKFQVWSNFIKKRLWHKCFPVNFAKSLRTSFWQNTSGRLILWFMAFSDWELLSQRFKNICCRKIDCDKYYRLSKDFFKFPRTPGGTVKAIATFNETSNCKFPQAVGAIWAPGTDFS